MKSIAFCTVVFTALVMFAATAHAQGGPGQGSNCHNCNSYAQCQQYQSSGGCGCQSGYDPVRHGYRCAWCGVCFAGTCIYNCNGQWFGSSPTQAAPTLQSHVAPAWTANTALSSSIEPHSHIMAIVFDVVRETVAKGSCAMLRGVWRGDDGLRANWSMVETPSGGVTIIVYSRRHLEQLYVESNGWGLARDNRNIVVEKTVN